MTLDLGCDRTQRMKSNKNRPSVTKNRGSFSDEMKTEEDFEAMLGNEPGQDIRPIQFVNEEHELGSIYEVYECPQCQGGLVHWESPDGDEGVDICDECDGSGTLTVMVE